MVRTMKFFARIAGMIYVGAVTSVMLLLSFLLLVIVLTCFALSLLVTSALKRAYSNISRKISKILNSYLML